MTDIPQIPRIVTRIPGPSSEAILKRVKKWECPQVTYVDSDFPVTWEEAHGCMIRDADDNWYLDLSGGFGVANAGHNHPQVSAAVRKQMESLTHGMGDVHPSRIKADLLDVLSQILPEGLDISLLSNSGSEAVESALKTAFRYSGKPGVIAMKQGYHGLTMGALSVTAWPFFRNPFKEKLYQGVFHVPFPEEQSDSSMVTNTLGMIDHLIRNADTPIGALIIEPVQGRGGCRIPHQDFLKGLKSLCMQYSVVLIFDEVYTGFGRTGKWFACEHENIIPDLICIGKGMGNGYPISACVGRYDIMAAWGESQGEAVHTSTFLGHPIGCAAALGTIKTLQEENLIEASRIQGKIFYDALLKLKSKYSIISDVRGRGLMLGVEFSQDNMPSTEKSIQMVKKCLKKGLILLAGGESSNVLCITPPLSVTPQQISIAVDIMEQCLQEICDYA